MIRKVMGLLCLAGLFVLLVDHTAEAQQTASKNPQQLLQIDAVSQPGAQPIRDQVQFHLTSYGPDRTEIFAKAEKGKPAQVTLPEGRYHLVTSYGGTRRSEDLMINGQQQHVVNLQSGWVELKLLSDFRSKPMTGADILWKVYIHRKSSDGSRVLLHEARGAQPMIPLPAGWYVIEAHYGNKVSKHSVEVQMGNAIEYRLVHGG